MKKALISVTDKSGIVEFCSGLVELGFQIVSTGGTMKVLKEEGLSVMSIEELTGFPEILDGRVKTLHPKVHGGILYRRGEREHVQTVMEHKIQAIDMVVVNLYDFEGSVKSGKSQDEIIENIDIGGPSMIRSAAKNYKDVLVVTDTKDYAEIYERLKNNQLDENYRRKLAYKAFSSTAYYDAMISRYFAGLEGDSLPEKLTIGLSRQASLRYGENPHQQAAVYQDPFSDAILADYHQLHGKELSFNNLNDLNAALALLREFDRPVAVAVKHATPCGVGTGADIYQAFCKAYEADKLSIFGGIVALNRSVDGQTARLMKEIFLEVIAAPDFSDEALEILKEKKNLRLLALKMQREVADWDMKFINGKVLVQEADRIDHSEFRTVTNKKPSPEEIEDLKFAMTVCKHVKSNAIVLAKDGGTLAIGGGQTARIWALKNAVENSEGRSFQSAVMASDAFFPFDDCVRYAGEKGITAIIQPGGASKDQESVDACNELGIAMVFTGIRHFKH